MATIADPWSAGLSLVASILLAVSADQCIFSTATNYKAPDVTALESFVIKDYHNDCELLCYTNPSRCLAANVVVRDDDTYWCQFVSVVVKLEQIEVLEANPGGKYIYRSAALLDAVDVAKEASVAKCSASSNNDGDRCENALDDEASTAWKTNQENSGAWIQIDLSSWYLINEVVLHPSCEYSGAAVSDVRVYYKDEHYKDINDMTCSQICFTSAETYSIKGSIITNFIKVEIIAVCESSGDVGFKEIEIFALTPAGV